MYSDDSSTLGIFLASLILESVGNCWGGRIFFKLRDPFGWTKNETDMRQSNRKK